MTRWELRLRAILSNHFETVLAILVIVGVVGFWLAAGAYLFPGTHTVDRTVSSWDTSGNFSHQATVEGDGTAFEPGTVVSGRTVYFESVMPVLETTHTFRYEASDSGRLDAVIQTRLVIEGVSGDGDNAVTYWSVSEVLDTEHVTDVAPGEPVRTSAAVNVSAAMTRARQISEELGTPTALLQAQVVVDVQTGGTVNDQPVNESLTYILPMTFRGGIYRMGEPVSPAGHFETVDQVTVTDPPGFVAGVLGPLLFLGSLLSGGALITARRDGLLSLNDRERTWLTYQADRSEFDDWISRVSLPEQAFNREVMEAATLADLVDVAIDANEPVLEDPQTGDYHVLHDGYRYTFERPPALEGRGIPTRANGASADASDVRDALRDQPYQHLRQLAARRGLDVGASPSKADLVDALARAGVDPRDLQTDEEE